MKSFKTPNVVPPGGGWIWNHPETGDQIYGGSADMLISNAREYCRRNHLPIGLNFEQNIIDSVCARLPDICSDTEPPTPMEMAAKFARAAVTWVANGATVVSPEQFQQRLDTCRACERWNGEAFFGLGRCGKCGCSGVKLYMDTEKCPLSKWT